MSDAPKKKLKEDELALIIVKGLAFYGVIAFIVALSFCVGAQVVDLVDSKLAVIEAKDKAESIRIIGQAARDYPEGAAFILGAKHGE